MIRIRKRRSAVPTTMSDQVTMGSEVGLRA